ncbi:hypothetical protein CJD38_02685 [Stenotrophobium rhamnosiphilum]|uniref:Uncharacterized protein n=2 Tax=Stenotrophobium rhamnosiphilum TaxID=2029166 RepID=A0A2T5MKC2_9GAMM|nr:hypothetical protein CJD38_02685 [Stenotrophobium rhamnosiphilum]
MIKPLCAFFLLAITVQANAAIYWTTSYTADGNFSSYGAALQYGIDNHIPQPCAQPLCSRTIGQPYAYTSGWKIDYTQKNSSGNNFNPGSVTAQLSCTSPNLPKIAGTPPRCTNGPTCTPPKVEKPDGTCGDPCGTNSKQVKGQSDLFMPPSSICYSNCTMALQGQGDPGQFAAVVLGVVTNPSKYNHTWVAKYKENGSTCTGNSGMVPDDTPGIVQDAQTKNTAQWKPGSSCGYINGKYKCIGAVPSGGCVKDQDGEGVCTTSGGVQPTSPPGPDTGTAGVAAEPVAAITTNNTTTSIFNTTTVNNSTNGLGSGTSTGAPPGTTPDPDDDEPNTTCGGEGQQPCNALGGGTDCTSPPSTEGDPIAGYIAVQDWKQACALSTPPPEAISAAIDEGLGTTEQGGLLHQTGELDVTGWFDSNAAAGGGCPADIPVSLPQLSMSVSIPFSSMCPYVTLIRTLGLISAALYSLYIVQGAF